MTQDVPYTGQRLATYIGAQKAAEEKVVYRLIADRVRAAAAGGMPCRSLIDIGCATGDAIASLRRQIDSGLRSTGVDLSPDLIAVARQRADLAGVAFHVADGTAYRGDPHDVTLCLGVLGIFDDFRPMLEALIANTTPGGLVLVHALFNPDDIDVRILYDDHLHRTGWQRGFNIFSRKRISHWLAERGIGAEFHEVRLDLVLPRRDDYPHRAYTVDLADGVRRTTNGLCLLLPEALLEFRVK